MKLLNRMIGSVAILWPVYLLAQSNSIAPRAFINGTGPGWRALTQADFTNVNTSTNTWHWTNGIIFCTGKPMGVARSVFYVTNVEIVVEWKHLEIGGNSGLYLWANQRSIDQLAAGHGTFPEGIEVQVLDHGYTQQYERETHKKADWFTTHGDVFPTAGAQMKPFPPAHGMRSFPRKHLSKGAGEWNHYYVRAVNGEIRLWVNGEEVSGGNGCKPSYGYLFGIGRGADSVPQSANSGAAVDILNHILDNILAWD